MPRFGSVAIHLWKLSKPVESGNRRSEDLVTEFLGDALALGALGVPELETRDRAAPWGVEDWYRPDQRPGEFKSSRPDFLNPTPVHRGVGHLWKGVFTGLQEWNFYNSRGGPLGGQLFGSPMRGVPTISIPPGLWMGGVPRFRAPRIMAP
jgi:hypothetical protein